MLQHSLRVAFYGLHRLRAQGILKWKDGVVLEGLWQMKGSLHICLGCSASRAAVDDR